MRKLGTKLRTSLGLFTLFLILIAPLAACGGSGDDDDDDSSGASGEVQSRDTGDSGGGIEATAAMASDEEEAEAEDADVAAAPSSDGVNFEYSYVAQAQLDRLIIRTVTINLTVESVADGATWIRDLALRKSGFVFSSNTYVRDESEFAQMTIRVPSNELDSTMQELREHQLVDQVDSEESTSQDVSQEYVDNDSRLEALEETQRRFLALLSEADSVEEILRIEAELTDIRSQIETIKGRQNYLDQMTAFSTVTITLHTEDEDIEEIEEDDDGFIARIFGDSWDSASGVIEGILAATITLGIIGLAILPIVAIAYFIARVVYRRTLGVPETPVAVADKAAPAEQSN